MKINRQLWDKLKRLDIEKRWAQLSQLMRGNREQAPIWDGDLISKEDMRLLVDMGLAVKFKGYNLPTELGASIYQALADWNSEGRHER